ncbi:bifunctional glutamate N-acetyltransferase/amino-acid acetyltransferase ArgJ [Candidatus Micrarchaeota archaeon]|nr:bifunctional glutamate N-acetyltransferase/amino-acid acetyltransferase ArgJ [Candidatus Micrarchaeota archaeon]
MFEDQPIQGILCGGEHVGLRKKSRDLAVFYSTTPASFACVNTANRFAAPPNQYNQRLQGTAQLVVVNSGNANAANGSQGMADCHRIAQHAAKQFHVNPRHVALASTGIIGKPLDVSAIESGLERICLNNTASAWLNATTAIQTTDQTLKYASARVGPARIVAVAKGAGMINPAMATMLCFVFTDAKIAATDAHEHLKTAVNETFNRISVDGCQSTNDTVMLLANGLAGPVDPTAFQHVLKKVCLKLAKSIVADGEGTQQTFELTIKNACHMQQAQAVAKAILHNALVQTAFCGTEPNVGRLVAALGAANTDFNPQTVKIHVNDALVFHNHAIQPFAWNAPTNPVRINVDLDMGATTATFYGCDLTTKYVAFNTAYTT